MQSKRKSSSACQDCPLAEHCSSTDKAIHFHFLDMNLPHYLKNT